MDGQAKSGWARAPLAAWRGGLLALLALTACAEIFGIGDGEPPKQSASAGRAGKTSGSGGTAGKGAIPGGRGGSMGGGKATGGSGSTSGAGGDAGHGGEPSSGASGDGGSSGKPGAGVGGKQSTGGGGGTPGAGGGGQSGAGESGLGGAGETAVSGSGGTGVSGSGGTEPNPLGHLGSSCDGTVKYACADANVNEILRCVPDNQETGGAGQWTYYKSCYLHERCDPESLGQEDPACLYLDTFCVERAWSGPICQGIEVVDCSPNVYWSDRLTCPFGCSNGACVSTGSDELTLHIDAVDGNRTSWSGPIPVCLKTTDTSGRQHFAWLRSEVERVWSRFVGADFVGWDDCVADATGVVVSFKSDCEGSLVSGGYLGYPGTDKATPITLCRDAVDAEHEESVTRLLARHEFGHLLGLSDGADYRDTVMVRGVRLGDVDKVQPQPADYGALILNSGLVPKKPSGSLVTTTGACLTAINQSAGSSVQTGLCANTPSRQWLPLGTQVEDTAATSPPLCLELPSPGYEPYGAGTMALAECSPSVAQAFGLIDAQWRTPNYCVAPMDDSAEGGTLLVSEPCTEVGDLRQVWTFEIVGSTGPDVVYLIRIRYAHSSLCASAKPPAPVNTYALDLEPCGTGTSEDDPQIFKLFSQGDSGLLGSGGLCVTTPEGPTVLSRAGCSFLDHWFLSGAITGGSGAFTTTESGYLAVEDIESPPPAAQVFDFYF